jgi:hypothetical protein
MLHLLKSRVNIYCRHDILMFSSHNGSKELSLVNINSLTGGSFGILPQDWPDGIQCGAYHSGLLVLVDKHGALHLFSIVKGRYNIEVITPPELPKGYPSGLINATTINERYICIATNNMPREIIVWERSKPQIIAWLDPRVHNPNAKIQPMGDIYVHIEDIIIRQNILAALTNTGNALFWDLERLPLDSSNENMVKPDRTAHFPVRDLDVDTIFLSEDCHSLVAIDLFWARYTAMISPDREGPLSVNEIHPVGSRYLRIDKECQIVALALISSGFEQDIPKVDLFRVSEKTPFISINPPVADNIGQFLDFVIYYNSVIYICTKGLLRIKFKETSGVKTTTSKAFTCSRYITLCGEATNR